MEHIHKAMAVIAQLTPPWVGVAVGHFSDGITLQNAAYLSSVVYSVVSVAVLLRKRK